MIVRVRSTLVAVGWCAAVSLGLGLIGSAPGAWAQEAPTSAVAPAPPAEVDAPTNAPANAPQAVGRPYPPRSQRIADTLIVVWLGVVVLAGVGIVLWRARRDRAAGTAQ